MEPTEQPPAATRSRRFLAGVALAAALSAITGVISYEHGLAVATWLGNHGLVAYLVPLVPDLLIASASLTLLEASAQRSRRPWIAMAGLVAGIGWTVAMNVAAGWREGPGGAILNAGVPLAFVLTFESLLWLIRRGRGVMAPMGSPATSSQPQPPEPLSTTAALAALLASDSQRKLAEVLGVPRSRVQAWAGEVAPVADDRGQGGTSAVPRGAEHSSRPAPPPAGVGAPVSAPAGVMNGQAAGG